MLPRWREVLILHLDTDYCRASTDEARSTLMFNPGAARHSIRIAALLMLALAAGCAVDHSPPPPRPDASQDVIAAPPRTAATRGEPVVVEPAQTSASQIATVEPSQPVATETAVTTAKPAVPATPSASPAKERSDVRTVTPAAKTPAKIAAAPAQPPKSESGPAQAKQPEAPPPLDMATLERRLKDTKAIGVFTKLALKNQVDDLLKQFRAFYQGQLKTTLAALRQPYDLLLLKILSLLQDGDPPLAHSIAASREALWGILADRDKFNALD